jgi:hypothetical protein
MAIKINGVTAIDNNRKGRFETLNLGSFATADRPSNPEEGLMIFDSDMKKLMTWNGTEWDG